MSGVGYNFSGFTVLVVDDNTYMVALLKAILKALGIGTVVSARDGTEGLALMGERPVDIVFSDWEMAPMSGIDFVRAVRDREHSPNPYVPIVMVTGFTEAARVREARDAGVNEFLAKPVSPVSVAERVDSIISRPRPFVSSKMYFGPDRRRHRNQPHDGPERRAPKQNGPE